LGGLAAVLAAPLLTAGPGVPAAQPPPQSGPIVVGAADGDPDNQLWNCETSRVPFGNEQIDASRCFTFRYAVPPGGIQSATVHIAINTLGSLQDTDATALAVGEPYEPCAWGQGRMPGCVVVHGGFKGGEKSLNLNLLDIACDASVQGSPEAQRLVLDQLQTGVLHMILEDDTAVYSAQLVLNGGPPSFACGTSTSEPQAFLPRPKSATDLERRVNTWLTGTPAPPALDKTGGAIAAVAGAGLLAFLALSNVLAARNRPAAGTDRPAAALSSASASPASQANSQSAARQTVLPAADVARDQVVDSLPDARDNAADLIIDAASERDKKRRVDVERRRLEAAIAERQRAADQTAAALKQAIDRGAAGAYDSAQLAWKQASAELQRARDDLRRFNESFSE
jgi:hypothetical protein